MAEPNGSNYPSSLDNVSSLLGLVTVQKQFVVSGYHDEATTTITTTSTIVGVNAPGYLVNGATGEIVYFGTISGNQFQNCVRGADSGPSGAPMANGSILFHIDTAKYHNQNRAAILAVETALGVNPQGGASDLATRLNALTQITLGFDGGGAALPDNTYIGPVDWELNNFTWTNWFIELQPGETGSITLEPFYSTYSNWSGSLTSMVGAGTKPAIASAQKATAAISGWTTAVLNLGSILVVKITGMSSCTKGSITFKGTRPI